ncbi:alpha/beta hydrolase [Prochlorococcus marinus]|uniref:Probable esterase n=1 Tax=Prochlorococcus marinus (strain MIT 9211) TaxID=93059 RepID=A9BDN9_PROM4|nr:alpha/beta fold hydrolase [Prochlorococcus marinus]ABX08225.1 probable esterase [Prochlorococcus marinus str. MIT 9211]
MEEDLISVDFENATHRLILLHGWGADAEDLVPVGKALANQLSIGLQLICLRAPEHLSEGDGRQWYPLFPPDWSAVPDAIKKLQSRFQKNSFSSIPFSKTFLLGFSQGGAMALASGCAFPFAGLIGCSAYPHPDWLPQANTPPIFLTHGDNDELVPLEAAKKIFALAKQNNNQCDIYTFNGGHEIPQEAIDQISSFISSRCV